MPGFAECEDGVEGLYRAAGGGDEMTAKRLLTEGVDANSPNNGGRYPLNAAVVRNYRDLVRLLLAHRADPDLQNQQGETPLIAATKYGGGNESTHLLPITTNVKACAW